MEPTVTRQLDSLEQTIAPLKSVVVALSGGVDSAVVAAAARRALGDRALAVTLGGPAVPMEEIGRARDVARHIGIRHRIVNLDPTQDERYANNPANRCYFCRSQEGALLALVAKNEGFQSVVDGIHRDDLGDDRPGIQAMNEHGVHHPLLEAGLGKEDVRRLARELDLPNWDSPSNSCLASRVAHGELILPELLARVDLAETFLRELGFRQVRVRTSHGAARVEVGRDEVPRFADSALRTAISERLRSLGFSQVDFDPEGYRPGGGRGPAGSPSRPIAASPS
jgi:pyridinium-3,5-biscarboxylic acid mononucleotide sulfurtransferase